MFKNFQKGFFYNILDKGLSINYGTKKGGGYITIVSEKYTNSVGFSENSKFSVTSFMDNPSGNMNL